MNKNKVFLKLVLTLCVNTMRYRTIRLKPMLPSKMVHAIIFVGMAFIGILVTGCSAIPDRDVRIVLSDTSTPTPHKIAIVNASQNTINDIKYKPCGSDSLNYRRLTGNLRPAERFVINIYSQCVDLLATNAFKKKLGSAKNVDLESIKTWTIK